MVEMSGESLYEINIGVDKMEKTYNPMSKEFKDECERLGITGRQLTVKYKKEGKSIEKGIYKKKRFGQSYTDEELLWYLVQFYEKYGRLPTYDDFTNNSKYPSYATYINRFGSWQNALKLVGLDVDSMVKKGIIGTVQQKGRLGEILIRDHFEKYPIDLAGENCHNPWDGICPNGMNYDVKSSGLLKDRDAYKFNIHNKYREDIEIYYFLAFNKDYTKFEYGWRVYGEIVEKDNFLIGLNNNYEFNISNMKRYDITDKLTEVLKKYGFLK
jgi:hypothetical protein